MGVGYEIRPARYSKNLMAVICESGGDGWKTRAMRLADNLAVRYTHRENAYLMSKRAAEKFERLYAQGWDGAYMTRTLVPPNKNDADIVETE